MHLTNIVDTTSLVVYGKALTFKKMHHISLKIIYEQRSQITIK